MPTRIGKMEWQECGLIETQTLLVELKVDRTILENCLACLLKLNISKELYAYIIKQCIPEYS